MSDGTVSWYEIQVPDMEQAKAFYGPVLGWTFQPFGEGFEVALNSAGNMVGGLDTSAGDATPAGRHVRVYFGTDELEAVLDRVTKAGGKILNPRTQIAEDMGWFATISDPSGIVVSFHTSKAAD
jgi:uncharacterized protein